MLYKGVFINKLRIDRIKLIDTNKKGTIFKYKLFTENRIIILNISKTNIEKITILKYIKSPFFILSYKNIDNEIKVNDSFEISNDEKTLSLECQSSCGLNN